MDQVNAVRQLLSGIVRMAKDNAPKAKSSPFVNA